MWTELSVTGHLWITWPSNRPTIVWIVPFDHKGLGQGPLCELYLCLDIWLARSLQMNHGCRWMADNVEMRNGWTSMCDELCTLFFLSSFWMIVFGLPHGSDGTSSINRFAHTLSVNPCRLIVEGTISWHILFGTKIVLVHQVKWTLWSYFYFHGLIGYSCYYLLSFW